MRRWKKQIRHQRSFLWAVLLVCLAGMTGCGNEKGTVISLVSGSGAVSVSSEVQEEEGTSSGEVQKTGSDSGDRQDSGGGKTGDSAESEPDSSESSICVYVCGAVRNPGVYRLSRESRVYEAIAAAGGMTEAADLKSLNQAAGLEDGQQVTVYTAEEAKEAGISAVASGTQGTGGVSGTGGSSSGKVNLNTAAKEELMTLPGIGEARAEAIIRYREETGPFQRIEDIQNIEGIKEKSFAKLQDRIEV